MPLAQPKNQTGFLCDSGFGFKRVLPDQGRGEDVALPAFLHDKAEAAQWLEENLLQKEQWLPTDTNKMLSFLG